MPHYGSVALVRNAWRLPWGFVVEMGTPETDVEKETCTCERFEDG